MKNLSRALGGCPMMRWRRWGSGATLFVLVLVLPGCVATGTAFYNPETQQAASCGVAVGWATPVMVPALAALAIDTRDARTCERRLRNLGFITEDDLTPPAGVMAKRATADRSACLNEAPSRGWPTTFGIDDYEWRLRARTEALIRCLLSHGWVVRQQ